jgi:hypothetical protein
MHKDKELGPLWSPPAQPLGTKRRGCLGVEALPRDIQSRTLELDQHCSLLGTTACAWGGCVP